MFCQKPGLAFGRCMSTKTPSRIMRTNRKRFCRPFLVRTRPAHATLGRAGGGQPALPRLPSRVCKAACMAIAASLWPDAKSASKAVCIVFTSTMSPLLA